VSFTPLPLYLQGKSPRYPLDWTLRRENLTLAGIRTPTVQPAVFAIPTELSRPDSLSVL
jgi:hypothetical protein